LGPAVAKRLVVVRPVAAPVVQLQTPMGPIRAGITVKVLAARRIQR